MAPHGPFYFATILYPPCRLYEREKEKCWPYWPRKQNRKEGDSEGDGLNSELCSATYGNFTVTLQSTETGLCYIRRVLVVHNKVSVKVSKCRSAIFASTSLYGKNSFYVIICTHNHHRSEELSLRHARLALMSCRLWKMACPGESSSF